MVRRSIYNLYVVQIAIGTALHFHATLKAIFPTSPFSLYAFFLARILRTFVAASDDAHFVNFSFSRRAFSTEKE